MITRYKQFESNIQDDTEPTKEYLDGVKRFICLVKENTEVFSFCDEFDLIFIKIFKKV